MPGQNDYSRSAKPGSLSVRIGKIKLIVVNGHDEILLHDVEWYVDEKLSETLAERLKKDSTYRGPYYLQVANINPKSFIIPSDFMVRAPNGEEVDYQTWKLQMTDSTYSESNNLYKVFFSSEKLVAVQQMN